MADWICHPGDNRETRLVPVFRRCFEVRSKIKTAHLRLTAHGVYEAELNGVRVTENKFMPGLTSYYYRIQVQEYDVRSLLQEGDNELRVTVGDGWWRWNNNFGYTLSLWGELRLVYADGSEEALSTDEAWEVGLGPIVRTDLQKGEVYDARLELHGWQKAALCVEHTEGALIENQSVPVREKERFPGKPMHDAAGNLVIDFSQNLAGYVKMTLRKPGPDRLCISSTARALPRTVNSPPQTATAGKRIFRRLPTSARVRKQKPTRRTLPCSASVMHLWKA